MLRDSTSAFAIGTSGRDVADLIAQLGSFDAKAVFFFTSEASQGIPIGQEIRRRFPQAEVIGCSSYGEFTDVRHGTGGISVLALGANKVRRCASALLNLKGDVATEVRKAAKELSRQAGGDLRELDPRRYVGVVLIDSHTRLEEKINEELGNVAPMLSFVGGSAADHLQFHETWVFRNGEGSSGACALVLLELAVPFMILKTCSAMVTTRHVTVTRAKGRVIHELDGQPAASRYAELVGVTPDKLEFGFFLQNPLGMMIDGQPWLRAPTQVEGDNLILVCAIPEGSALEIMRSGDLIKDTRDAFANARATFGKPFEAGLLFNCAYRRMESDMKGLNDEYHRILSGFPLAGFHTYGESWLGHLNQTLTGLLIG